MPCVVGSEIHALGRAPAQLKPVCPDGPAPKNAKGTDDPVSRCQTIIQVGTTDRQDRHPSRPSSSDARRRVLNDHTGRTWMMKRSRRSEVTLRIGLALADIRSRYENWWVGYLP